MADGTTHDETTALIPASLMTARAALMSHPLGTHSLQAFQASPLPYATQMAKTGLGSADAAGQRSLWTVSKVPLYAPDGCVWPGAWGTRRDDTGAPLGVVGNRYRPLQNAQLAEALEVAFSQFPIGIRPQIINAGALGGGAGMGVGRIGVGARVFAQLALPAELSRLLHVPADKDSEIGAFLTLTNTHDGTSTAVIGASCIRIVCRNTWQLAHKQSKRQGLALKHTVSNVKGYRKLVGEWFREIGIGYRSEGERLRAYASKTLNPATVQRAVSEILFGEVLPAEEQSKAQRANTEAVIEMIEGRDGAFVARGDVTAYSIFQATTAFEMHRRPARGELETQTETRLWHVLTNDNAIPRAQHVLDALIRN
jgi:hypothetical protein